MTDNKNRFEPEDFKKLLEELIYIEKQPGNSIKHKIDVLERVLEYLRIKERYLENKLDLEEFLQGEVFVDCGRLHYYPPATKLDVGSGTHPMNLQPMLLMFLLLYHREAYAVYDIIEKFIDRIWDQLAVLDFKRTKTGVVRCFTNTRFAAHTLRDSGLLRFTRKEAYRTWVLSLPGFLVASVLVKWSRMDFQRLRYQHGHGSLLHPEIWAALNSIENYDIFVNVLAQVCEPNTEVFSTFEHVLRQAYSLLEKYWRIVQNPRLSIKERKEISMEHIKQLDETPEIEKFYSEFSKCVNIERLLGDLDEPPSLF